MIRFIMRLVLILTYFFTFILISGCFQSTTMIGPAFTLASTGNVVQAGFNYSANKAIKDNTGKTTTEHLMSSIEKKKIKKNENKRINKIKKELISLVKSNLKKTREKIISLQDSNLLN